MLRFYWAVFLKNRNFATYIWIIVYERYKTAI